MKNLTIMIGGAVRCDLTGIRLRARGDLAPGATVGIASTGTSPLGAAVPR